MCSINHLCDRDRTDWPIPSKNANCSESAPGKLLPKLSYFSSYSISLDYCNFAVFPKLVYVSFILFFQPIQNLHVIGGCTHEKTVRTPNYPEMEFLNGILVEVSVHKLQSSQTQVFFIIFPFYKMLFMNRLDFSCFADFFVFIFKT
jgi:hypothetical protein